MREHVVQKSPVVAQAKAPAKEPAQAAPSSVASLPFSYSQDNIPVYPAEPAEPDHPQGLPARLRRGVEALSGVSMHDVRVHRNSSQASRLGALAYARGSQIHLGPGQERHLAHEAWHVAQQKQGRVLPTTVVNGEPVNDDAALEAEADRIGAQAAQAVAYGAPKRPLRAAALPRLGPIQGVFTAKPRLDDQNKVDKFEIRGRPDGRFGGRQGSHTTAYAVYRDVIESATLGRNVTAAYASLSLVVDDLRKFPALSTVALPTRPVAADVTDVKKEELESLAHYYIEVRDGSDAATADLGAINAITHGEGPALRTLRKLENGDPASLPAPEVMGAYTIMKDKLFDKDAAEEIESLNIGNANLEADKTRRQHWMTMAQAFPKLFDAIKTANLDPLIASVPALAQPQPVGAYKRLDNSDLFETLSVRVSRATGKLKVEIGGRTTGPFDRSGEGMGSHTVPHGLIVHAIRTQIEGTPALDRASTVTERLLHLIRVTLSSRISDDAFVDNLSSIGGTHGRTPRQKFDLAHEVLQDAEETIENCTTPVPPLEDIEQAIEAILLHHNVSPLSAVSIGLADNNGEQGPFAKMRDYEENGSPRGRGSKQANTEFVQEIHKNLHDSGAIAKIHGASPGDEIDFPGLGDASDDLEKLQAIAAIQDTFYDYLELAAPRAYAELTLNAEVDMLSYLEDELSLQPSEAKEIVDLMSTVKVKPSKNSFTNREESNIGSKRNPLREKTSKKHERDPKPSNARSAKKRREDDEAEYKG